VADLDSRRTKRTKERKMARNIDEAKGRAKRAAAELTDDEKLKREGTVDKAAGKAKETETRRSASSGTTDEHAALGPTAAGHAP
jgi:uncharacterized protein YjbJ (UPF0337 family)